jgi:hypothetical protein
MPPTDRWGGENTMSEAVTLTEPVSLLTRLTQLTPQDRRELEAWLCGCLVSRDCLQQHIRFLQKTLMPEQLIGTWQPPQVEAVFERGLAALSFTDLIQLALHPLVLHEWFDRIQETIPVAWQAAMAEHGNLLRQQYGFSAFLRRFVALLVLRRLQQTKMLEGGMLEGEKDQPSLVTWAGDQNKIDLPEVLAQDCYGVSQQTVEISLHTAPAPQKGMLTPYLEVDPAPKKTPMTVAVHFPDQQVQEFVIDGANGNAVVSGEPIANEVMQNAKLELKLEIRSNLVSVP